MLSLIFRIIIISSFALGQIQDFNLTIDFRNTMHNQSIYLNKLKEDLEFYFISNDFLKTNQDFKISLDANMTIESVSNNNIISAYVLFSNRQDQILFSDGVDFEYILGETLIHSTVYSSLTSFLDYNIFIMLASELDKHNYKGGENYYIRAQDIALKGTLSEYPRKLNKRLKKCRELKENTYLRNIKFLYTTIYNQLFNSEEDVDEEIIEEYLGSIYDALLSIDDEYGTNKETIMYFNSIKEEFSDLCLEYDMEYLIKFLIQYDSDNSEFYKDLLD